MNAFQSDVKVGQASPLLSHPCAELKQQRGRIIQNEEKERNENTEEGHPHVALNQRTRYTTREK
jgi:hypothetical protein